MSTYFSCKYLAENVTVAIPVIGALLFLFTIAALMRTSLTDPGIIPRATLEEATYVEKQIGMLSWYEFYFACKIHK